MSAAEDRGFGDPTTTAGSFSRYSVSVTGDFYIVSIQGFSSNWTEIPNIYPVHGAATAFYRGKFWIMGGSTGDDR